MGRHRYFELFEDFAVYVVGVGEETIKSAHDEDEGLALGWLDGDPCIEFT